MQSKVDKRTKEVCVIFSSTLYTLLPKVKILLQIITTKVSAGVSTGIGDHESKYSGKESQDEKGDEQFEIDDNRNFDTMYQDMESQGLQPVLNEYLYV